MKPWAEMTIDEIHQYSERIKENGLHSREQVAEALNLCLFLAKKLNQQIEEIGTILEVEATKKRLGLTDVLE